MQWWTCFFLRTTDSFLPLSPFFKNRLKGIEDVQMWSNLELMLHHWLHLWLFSHYLSPKYDFLVTWQQSWYSRVHLLTWFIPVSRPLVFSRITLSSALKILQFSCSIYWNTFTLEVLVPALSLCSTSTFVSSRVSHNKHIMRSYIFIGVLTYN